MSKQIRASADKGSNDHHYA